MIDYKQMYKLMSEATSKSLYILSKNNDEESHRIVRFILQEATIRANRIHTATTQGDCPVNVETE